MHALRLKFHLAVMAAQLSSHCFTDNKSTLLASETVLRIWREGKTATFTAFR